MNNKYKLIILNYISNIKYCYVVSFGTCLYFCSNILNFQINQSISQPHFYPFVDGQMDLYPFVDPFLSMLSSSFIYLPATFYPSVDGHLACFLMLAIMNTAAINMGKQMYLQDLILIF